MPVVQQEHSHQHFHVDHQAEAQVPIHQVFLLFMCLSYSRSTIIITPTLTLAKYMCTHTKLSPLVCLSHSRSTAIYTLMLTLSEHMLPHTKKSCIFTKWRTLVLTQQFFAALSPIGDLAANEPSMCLRLCVKHPSDHG